MACEIVITSVPRGVKLGRTGFQVAMQTAGMRDDVAAALERMAGYRHLPPGSGPNPVSYFHRMTTTVAGRMNVIGRIRDAGVDFSNRSNKLAHMVTLDSADLGAVAASSPAAVLAAIEGRLASTWTGGPEERQIPFSLAGIPSSNPAICTLWQQMAGDAGWAGVMAERALRNEPTLLIGTDSSDESCRRMLMLFQQALALIPPNKRWGVTFDTTTLTPDVLWRGTYAGSPESLVSQAGVHVIDLRHPQTIPATMAVGELVEEARRGPKKVAAASIIPVTPTGLQPSLEGVGSGEPAPPTPPAPPPPPKPPGRGGRAVVKSGTDTTASIAWGMKEWILLASFVALLLVGAIDLTRRFVVPKLVALNKVHNDEPALGGNATKAPSDANSAEPDGKKNRPEAAEKKRQDEAEKKPQEEAEKKPQEEAEKKPQEEAAAKTAFAEFQKCLAKPSEKPYWPLDNGHIIIPPSDAVAKLDAEVVVGTTKGFAPTAIRDGESPKWKIMLDSKCLAIVDLTGGGLSVHKGDCDDEKMYGDKTPLPFMPIAFKAGGELVASDWIWLDRHPKELLLETGNTIFDLLESQKNTLDLPSVSLPPDAEVAPKPIEATAANLTLRLARSSDGQFVDMLVTLPEFKDAVLGRLELRGTQLIRVGKAWPERSSRFGELPFTVKGSKSKPKDIVRAILQDHAFQKVEANYVKPLCDAWSDPEKTAEAIDYETQYAAEELRASLLSYLCRDMDAVKKSKMEQIEKKKQAAKDGSGLTESVNLTSEIKKLDAQWTALFDSTTFLTHYASLLKDTAGKDYPEPSWEKVESYFPDERPKKGKDETDIVFRDRQSGWDGRRRTKFAEAQGKWKTARDEFVLEMAKDPGELRRFLQENLQKQKSDLEAFLESKGKPKSPKVQSAAAAEVAAIHVLLDLDGVVLAKTHRSDLENLLRQVPIARLAEGQATLQWKLPGMDEAIVVPVATVRVAPTTNSPGSSVSEADKEKTTEPSR